MMATASPFIANADALTLGSGPVPRCQPPGNVRGFLRRSGAATVEFAIVAPLLFVLVLGIIEFGRAMMVVELLNNAARNGCRVGVLDGSDVNAITTAVNNTLASSGISQATTTVSVNGQSASNGTGNGNSSSSMASTGDAINVTVSVSANSVSWLPTGLFLKNRTLTSSVIMRRE